jgi:hypothetical protein
MGTPLLSLRAALGRRGGEIFGPSYVAGALGVRYGVDEQTDIGATATAAGVLEDELHAGIYALRLHVHREVVPRVLALHAGLGGGGHAAGSYIAGDLGLTLGYENPVFVPYGHASVLLSDAIGMRSLYMQTSREAEDGTPGRWRAPYSTLGVKYGMGARIPVGPRTDRVGSIYLEFTLVHLAGDDPTVPDEGFLMQRNVMLLGAGFEARYGRSREPQ